MPQPTTPLTRETILAHERLHPRIAALLKQVERVAARRPAQPVPEESLKLSRTLCREAAKLLGREGRGIGVPAGPAGPGLDHGGLAVALGQAIAALEAFEAEHSGQSKKLGHAIWQIDGPPMPVTRLLPKGHGGKEVKTRDPEAERNRREVYRLIMGRFKAGYDEGYQAAMDGKPPSARYAEDAWDRLMEREQGAEAARKAGEPKPRVRYEHRRATWCRRARR
ncbi:MAG: hypothetical protein JWQ89_282 [Devosia sp.]|uniref:hypothetical protein n=1 Tax=Devosia sp. TaxID=1871048 RepID=UPI0026026BEE|nr:hypothetical protein [Devosia sp.]MDB5538555.1 hypothetical protein [Devosia sp.]